MYIAIPFIVLSASFGDNTKSRRARAGVALEDSGRDSIRRYRSPKLRLRVVQVGGSVKACARPVAPTSSSFKVICARIQKK